jgi:hypothetical protein
MDDRMLAMSSDSKVSRRTQAWVVLALVGGVIVVLTSLDNFLGAASAGSLVSGTTSLLLGGATVVSAGAVARRGEVGRVTLLGLLGAAAFGWESLALAPVQTAVLGGRIDPFDVATAVAGLAVLAGSIGASLSEVAYRSATWESVGHNQGNAWLYVVVGAAMGSVIALFLPYATYVGNRQIPSYQVDAWNYFGGLTDTVTLVLMLTCGTLAALTLARPQLPYRWPLALVGAATFPYAFTPAQFGSKSQTGQAVSWEAGFWLILLGALVVAVAGIESWRRSRSAGAANSG